MNEIMFYPLIIGFAFGIVESKKIKNSLLYLFLLCLTISAMLYVSQAQYIALYLVIVYSGTISLVFVFVVALLGNKGIDLHTTKPKLKYIMVPIVLFVLTFSYKIGQIKKIDVYEASNMLFSGFQNSFYILLLLMLSIVLAFEYLLGGDKK